MNHKIYSLKHYQVYRDNNNEPLNVPQISGDINKIINELKNNKGYHMFLNPIRHIYYFVIWIMSRALNTF